jgi:hypothetical protein
MAYSTLVDRHPRLRLGCQTSTRVENASFQTRYRIYNFFFPRPCAYFIYACTYPESLLEQWNNFITVSIIEMKIFI